MSNDITGVAEKNPDFIKEVRRKLEIQISDISRKFLEREEVTRMLMLTIMSKSNAFLIGLPGLAKSDILKKICSCIDDYVWYQKQFTDETKESQIFGPIREHNDGTETYITRGMLVEANFGFLDEVFKSPKELQDSMLEVINEKVFKNGPDIVKVPLYSVFAASNEFAKQADSPFFDRLHFRCELHDLSERENFRTFIKKQYDTTSTVGTKFTLHDIDMLQTQKDFTEFPEPVMEMLEKLWEEYKIVQIRISTRTWGFIREILKISALANARYEVDFSDLFVLRWICWNNYTQRDENEALLHACIFGKKEAVESKLNVLEEEIASFGAEMVELEPFLAHKVDHRNFDEAGFVEIVEKIKTLSERYETALLKLKKIDDRLKFCLGVEKQIKENIFLMPIKNRVYDQDLIDKYTNFIGACERNSKIISQWLSENKTKLEYSNIRYKKQQTNTRAAGA